MEIKLNPNPFKEKNNLHPKTMNDLNQITHNIGKELTAMRIAAGYPSYEQFAFDKKLSRIQYYKMEKGTNCTLKSLIKVLDAHDLDFYDFLKKLSPEEKKDYAHKQVFLRS